MEAKQMNSGRWIVAAWDERAAQFRSRDMADPEQGYCYTVARSLEGLARIGIRTYATEAEAEAALSGLAAEVSNG